MGRSLKNAEGTGLPEGLLARLRLFWMVRIGPRLAEIRQTGKGLFRPTNAGSFEKGRIRQPVDTRFSRGYIPIAKRVSIERTTAAGLLSHFTSQILLANRVMINVNLTLPVPR